MEKEEDTGSPSWSASLFMQKTEDVARAVAAAVRSSRSTAEQPSKAENGSQIQRLQQHVSRIIKGLSSPTEVKSGPYNPEVLTIQKRQWANFHLQALDHKVWKEPSKLFESIVVVGLPADSDVQALHDLYFSGKNENSGIIRNALGGAHQYRIEPNLEPQVLFVYPPEKKLPLNYRDLLSYCLPAGVEVNAIERTPSMSELNEILLGQEHLKQSELSFVFRLQVADASTLYGCCVLVDEIVHKPSGLISMMSDGQPPSSRSTRHILTTRRCYCILSRFPFFELHFGVLNSIFTEERLQRLTKQVNNLELETYVDYDDSESVEERTDSFPVEDGGVDLQNAVETSQSSISDSISGETADDLSHLDLQNPMEDNNSKKDPPATTENAVSLDDSVHNIPVNCKLSNKDSPDRRLSNSVSPLLRYQQCESSDSSPSFRGSPIDDRRFRSEFEEVETEEASSSGQDVFSEQKDILEWAKANNNGSLQIICEYYHLNIPARGSTIKFHPLDHLHPLEYNRPNGRVVHIAGSTIDLRSCSSSFELAEAHDELMVEEEAASLSVWSIACLCGSLQLEHVLTLLTGALLEKQIVVVCSNLGILSALVLSIIPLIRPYRWQSWLMPVLPNDMLEFLDAPVPYIVGVTNKTTELQSKLTNIILVDANKNQVKSPSLPQLPSYKELYSRLSPYHSKLVGESYLGKKRPVYECNDIQVEAAKAFLGELRLYLDCLCSNLRSHTITNVQSNDDKVSLLLKESFIESFPSRDRPFMKLFLETQLFSVHTDFLLSFFQKE